MLAAAMLFEHAGGRLGDEAMAEAGRRFRVAVDTMMENPAPRPRGLGGSLSTSAFADAVARHVARH